MESMDLFVFLYYRPLSYESGNAVAVICSSRQRADEIAKQIIGIDPPDLSAYRVESAKIKEGTSIISTSHDECPSLSFGK